MFRICYVVESGNSLNGSEQSLINLIHELVKEDVEIHIAGMVHRPEFEAAVSGIRVNNHIIYGAIPIKKMEDSSFKMIDILKCNVKKGIIALSIPQAILFLLKNRIDIVHANTSFVSPTLLYAARILKIPYIWHIREFLDRDHGWKYITKNSNERLISDSVNVVAISKIIQSVWEERLGRECTLIYNGIPLENCYIRREKIFENGHLNVLMAGRVVETKGQIDIVRAVEELVESGVDYITVYLVGFRGSGNYEQKIRNYVQKNKLDNYIRMINFTTNLAEYRERCNVGIISSSSEAFGRVTVEYMASGVLTIGANAGGTSEIIEDGVSGLLYEPGDYKELANKLRSIFAHRDKMEQIAANGQKRAIEHFSIRRTSKQIFKLYEEVVNSEKGT